MSAKVINLDEHRPEPERRCSCRPNDLCYPHRLTNLADLVRAEVSSADGLLVDRVHIERLASEVLSVIDGIADECLSERRLAR